MRILFIGGRIAGIIGFLTALAKNHIIVAVATKDKSLQKVARGFGLTSYKSIHEIDLSHLGIDLILSVHGREIIKDRELGFTRHGGINVHPCLYKYKGADPIKRFLADGSIRASVGAHYITAKVDCGPVITEQFIIIRNCKTEIEVYNQLYPLYATVVSDALNKIESSGRDYH